MKLNKIVMLALIGAAVVSHVDTFTRGGFQPNPKPQEVERIDEQTLRVKRNDEWITYKRTTRSCIARLRPNAHSRSGMDSRNMHARNRPQYEFSDTTRVTLNVVESDGWCKQYNREEPQLMPNELTPDEKETIMMEDLFQD